MDWNVIFRRLATLFVARGVKAWLARIIIWSGFALALHSTGKFMLGFPVQLGEDFVLVLITIAPIVGLNFANNRKLDGDLTEMTKIASTDALTGLMNRRAFYQAVEASEEGTLLIIDIDHFKAVNDRYGHAAGDAVLMAMGDHLKRNVRASDLIGRIGGEEFALYLFGADSLEVDEIGFRLCDGFTVYNDTVPAPIKVTMSIGAAYSAMSKDVSELSKNADEALYAAKRSGRARLTFWQPVTSGRI